MTWRAAGQAWYLGPLRALNIRSSPDGLALATTQPVLPSLPGATVTCDPQVWISGQDDFKRAVLASQGHAEGSGRAWSARNPKNHVGKGLALLLPAQDAPQVLILGPHARPAAAPHEGRHCCGFNAPRDPSRLLILAAARNEICRYFGRAAAFCLRLEVAASPGGRKCCEPARPLVTRGDYGQN
jgi:hypothetical protein